MKLLLASLLVASTASAAPLEVNVVTGTPGGFLVTSTIVTGDKEAVVIDAQFDLADAHRLVAALLESKKTLTTIYVTHEHPDHYFGAVVLHQAFPKAKIVATPATIAAIQKTWAGKVKQWGPMYGDNLTTQPVLPTAVTTLTVDGQALEIKHGQGDSENNTYVWIPSIKTIVAGDTVYNGVHVWTADTNAASRKAWAKTLDDLAALHPTRVIAGHKDPKADDSPAAIQATKTYLADFDGIVAGSKTADEAEKKLTAKYASLQLPVIAHFGALAQYK